MVPSSNVIDLSDGVQTSLSRKYFVVLGGEKPDVHVSEMEAFDTVTNHGGVFTSYATKQQASGLFKPPRSASERQRQQATNAMPPLPSLAFVVWAGRSVGVMSREACMHASNDES